MHNAKQTALECIETPIRTSPTTSIFNEVSTISTNTLLGCILLLGLGLRLYSAYAGEGFHYFAINDEVIAYKFIMAFLSGEPYAQYIGQPEFAGAHLPGPLWTLYGVLLYKLGGGWLSSGILYSAAINSLVVYFVYRLSCDFVGQSYSLLIALLFATLPWPIYHSSGLYNPNVLSLLGVLLFMAMWRVCNERDSRYIFWVCLILFAIPQFHMIGIFYVPATSLVIFVLSPRINRRWLGLGIVAGVALYMPYFAGEMQHGWSNTRNLFSDETIHSWGCLKVFTEPASLLAAIPGSATPTDADTFKELGNRFFGTYYILLSLSVISLLIATVIYLGYMKTFTRVIKDVITTRQVVGEQRQVLFVGGMIFLPLILFTFTRHAYASRYAMIIMPLLFLLPALMVRDSSSSRLKKMFPIAVVITSIYSSYLSVVTYRYQEKLINDSSFVMPSFKKLEKISSAVNEDAGKKYRAHLTLSNKVQQLIAAGSYSKIYNVYPDYIDTDQHYKYSKGNDEPVHEYLLHLPQEALPIGSSIVYRDNNVVISSVTTPYPNTFGSNKNSIQMQHG